MMAIAVIPRRRWLVALLFPFLALTTAPQSLAKYSAQSGDAQVHEYADMNVRLSVPQKTYQPLPPENINPDATAIFFNPSSSFNLTVIAESLGPNLLTTE